MGAYLDQLIAFAAAHAGLAYLTLFAVALLEAAPILGSLIPGSTIILALSALVPGGELQLWPVLVSAALGAMLGDALAFWVGHREQRQILSAWPMSGYPDLVARSEAFFWRYGTVAVFFARFVPPVRALVPVTAGALGLSPPRFFAVNIPAILLWAPAHVLPGVVAGHELEKTHGLRLHHGLPIVAGAAALLMLAAWLLWRRHRQATAAI